MATSLQAPAKTAQSKWFSMAVLFFAGWLMVLILVASWVPDSRMTALCWVPDWIGRLADRDPNLRTAVPFIPLAFLLMHGFARCGLKRPVVWAVALCSVCLGFSEFGQIFLPHRTADLADVMWGGIGIGVGTVMAWGMIR